MMRITAEKMRQEKSSKKILFEKALFGFAGRTISPRAIQKMNEIRTVFVSRKEFDLS